MNVFFSTSQTTVPSTHSTDPTHPLHSSNHPLHMPHPPTPQAPPTHRITYHKLSVVSDSLHLLSTHAVLFQPAHNHLTPSPPYYMWTHSPTDLLPTVHRGQLPYQLGLSGRSHPKPSGVWGEGAWMIRMTSIHTHTRTHAHTYTHTCTHTHMHVHTHILMTN